MTSQERLRMRANAFEAWLAQPDNGEKHCELIDGEVFERAPSSQLPTLISTALIIALGSFVKARLLEQPMLVGNQVQRVVLSEADRLEGGSILPEFSLPLGEVFDVGYPIRGEAGESEGEA